MRVLYQLFAADVPLAFFPDGAPGPGPDPTAPLPDHDFDFTAVNQYSDLEYTEWRTTLGIRGRVRPGLDLFASISLYDVEDNAPYLQSADGSVTLVSGGLSWSF